MLGYKMMRNGQRGSETAKKAQKGAWRRSETDKKLRDRLGPGPKGKGGGHQKS